MDCTIINYIQKHLKIMFLAKTKKLEAVTRKTLLARRPEPSIQHLLEPQRRQISTARRDLQYPIYRGHFVHARTEELGQMQEVCFGGLEDGFAYFVTDKSIKFYFFKPKEADLNPFYNSNRVQIKEEEFLIQNVLALAFQNRFGRWRMAVATHYSINFYEFTGELENVLEHDIEINCNGEFMSKMAFCGDSVIYGGSSGQLNRSHFDSNLRQKQNWSNWICQRIKNVINDFNIRKKKRDVTQLDVDTTRNICFAIVEVYREEDYDNLQVASTLILIYSLGSCGNKFELVTQIAQEEVYRRLALLEQNRLSLDYLQFINTSIQPDYHELMLQITTRVNIQIFILVNSKPIEDEQAHLQPTSEYEVRFLQMPYHKMDLRVPFGVCVDDQNISNRAQPLIEMPQNAPALRLIYRDPQLALLLFETRLIARFDDEAHLSLNRTLERNLFQREQTDVLMSLYANTLDQAIECVDTDVSGQVYAIQRFEVNSLFPYTSLNTTQVYNSAPNFAVLSTKGLSIIVQFRPVDFFFTALKTTHINFICNQYIDLPFMRLNRCYGLDESCCQLLQIMIQQKSDFFVNVALEVEFRTWVNQVIQSQHRSENAQKYFGTVETTPQWAEKDVYVCQGSLVYEKAKQAYNWLTSQAYETNSESKKVTSTRLLISKLIAPFQGKPFFNLKAYNLNENAPLANFSVEQLQLGLDQVRLLLNLFNNDPEFYYQERESQKSELENTTRRHYVNGFSKHEYDNFARQTRVRGQLSDQSTIIRDVDAYKENLKMKVLFEFTEKLCQLFEFLIYLQKLPTFRQILNHINDKETFFKKMTLNHILVENDTSLIKQLMIQIINHDTSTASENAKYMQLNFNCFYSSSDHKITQVLHSLNEIYLDCYKNGLIRIQDQSFTSKVKRLLQWSNNSSITVERILQQEKISMYHRELPAEIQERIRQAMDVIEEVIEYVTLDSLELTFRKYMHPFATYEYYMRFLARKCQLLTNKELKINEYQACCSRLLQELGGIINLSRQPPKELSATVQVLLAESIRELQRATEIHSIVATTLYREGLHQLIPLLGSDCEIPNIPEIDQLLIRYEVLKQSPLEDKHVLDRMVRLSLKLATYNFDQCADMAFMQIMEKLSLARRLEILQVADGLIERSKQENIEIDLRKLACETKEARMRIELQAEMLEFAQSRRSGSEGDLRRIVSNVVPLERVLTFFLLNEVWPCVILTGDTIESLNYKMDYKPNVPRIEVLYANLLASRFRKAEDEWPDVILRYQIEHLVEKVEQRQSVAMTSLIEGFEYLCYVWMDVNKVVVEKRWFLDQLFAYCRKFELDKQLILEEYLVVFNQSENIQDSEIASQVAHNNKNVCLQRYCLQLVQSILTLVKFFRQEGPLHGVLMQDLRECKNKFLDWVQNADEQLKEHIEETVALFQKLVPD